MPCRDYDDNVHVVDNTNYKKIDELTRMLCGLCGVVGQTHRDRVPGLAKWWEAHQEQDRRREAYEKAQRDKKEAEDIAKLRELQAKYPGFR